MNVDELIIMLLEQVQGKVDRSGTSREISILYAVAYLEEHGWRRDGLTGESWIREG